MTHKGFFKKLFKAPVTISYD